MTTKEFNATAEGQKAMCARGGRIALLHTINEATRRLNPTEAYPREIIDAIADSEIDGMRDMLINDYNRLVSRNAAKANPAPQS